MSQTTEAGYCLLTCKLFYKLQAILHGSHTCKQGTVISGNFQLQHAFTSRLSLFSCSGRRYCLRINSLRSRNTKTVHNFYTCTLQEREIRVQSSSHHFIFYSVLFCIIKLYFTPAMSLSTASSSPLSPASETLGLEGPKGAIFFPSSRAEFSLDFCCYF